MKYQFAECECCGGEVTRVMFLEDEYDKYHHKTGRKRWACSHLECKVCGKKYAIDDSFDGPWH